MSFGTLSPISCYKTSTCLTESNAFFRSMNTATHESSFVYLISRINCKLLIYSTVDLSGVNPYYCIQYESLSSRCWAIFSCSHLSKIFSIMCLNVIGRQFSGSALSPSLKSRMTLDSFSSLMFSLLLSAQICLIIPNIIS